MPQQKLYKILLIGDSCIDEYYYGNCSRINPESISPLLNLEYQNINEGMCLNVRNNLQAFDNLTITVLTNKIRSIKKRFMDIRTNTQILRVDTDIISKPIKLTDIKNIDTFDTILISDYDKGFVDTDFIFAITEFTKCPIFIDSKKNILPNKNCFIKINEPEYANLQNKEKHDNIIITLGSKGARYREKTFPTQIVGRPNVIGAGDTFFAILGYHYMISRDIYESIDFANRAANIAVQNTGTYKLNKEDVNILYRHR